MTVEKIFSAYIDANILLAVAAIVWVLAKSVMSRTRLRSAFLTRLGLLYAVLTTIALAPLIAMAMRHVQQTGLLSGARSLNLSDFMVAQFLDGNIALAPTQFERLLMLRSDLTREIVTLASPLGTGIAFALCAGFAVFALRNLLSIWRMKGVIDRSYVWRRVGRVDIRITHEVRVPFSTRGFWRNYIIVPSALLAQADDMRIAVSHELQHIRQGDLPWEVCLENLRPFFFWNPAFLYCKREVERMRELACDQEVLARARVGIRDYCECLLRVCRTSLSADRRDQIMTPSVPFAQIDRSLMAAQSVTFLRYRVVSMLGFQRGHTQRFRMLLAMPLVGLMLLATIAAQPTQDWTQDRLMLSAIVNLERLNSRQN